MFDYDLDYDYWDRYDDDYKSNINKVPQESHLEFKDLVARGYKFFTNADKKEVEDNICIAARYGFDIVVSPIAYWTNGKVKDPKMSSLWIKGNYNTAMGVFVAVLGLCI